MVRLALRTLPQSQKSAVAASFGQGASSYDEEAEVQRFAAMELANLIEPILDQIPAGPILEVGCGTGFVSRHLSRLFPDRELELTDLTPEMLDRCRTLLGEHRGPVSFRSVDAEEFTSPRRYPLIVAGFVAQWFRDPAQGLRHLARSLAPGGVLLASLPGAESFPEWREACRKVGVEYPGVELLKGEDLLIPAPPHDMRSIIVRSSYTESYASPLHFFRHLKRIGAAPERDGHTPLPEIRAVLREMGGGPAGMTVVSYELIYLVLSLPDRSGGESPFPSGAGHSI